MTDYRRAFKIACELLNGDVLYGIDADTIFKIMMNKDGMTSSSSYEEYILSHLQDLDHGQYAIKELEQEPSLDKIRAEIKALSPEPTAYDVVDGNPVKDAIWETLIEVDKIIDKYKAESEEY